MYTTAFLCCNLLYFLGHGIKEGYTVYKVVVKTCFGLFLGKLHISFYSTPEPKSGFTRIFGYIDSQCNLVLWKCPKHFYVVFLDFNSYSMILLHLHISTLYLIVMTTGSDMHLIIVHIDDCYSLS